jgi:hypothetical protein
VSWSSRFISDVGRAYSCESVSEPLSGSVAGYSDGCRGAAKRATNRIVTELLDFAQPKDLAVIVRDSGQGVSKFPRAFD